MHFIYSYPNAILAFHKENNNLMNEEDMEGEEISKVTEAWQVILSFFYRKKSSPQLCTLISCWNLGFHFFANDMISPHLLPKVPYLTLTITGQCANRWEDVPSTCALFGHIGSSYIYMIKRCHFRLQWPVRIPSSKLVYYLLFTMSQFIRAGQKPAIIL